MRNIDNIFRGDAGGNLWNYLPWRWENRKLIVFLGGLYLFALIWQSFSGNTMMADSKQYVLQAENMLYHGSMYAWSLDEPIDMQGYTQRPPLYSVLVMIFHVIPHVIQPLLIVQCLLAMLSLLLVQQLVQLITQKRELPQWIIFVGTVLFPAQFIYPVMVMSEALLQFCLTAAFAAFIYAAHDQKGMMRHLIFANIFLSLAVLTKPVVVYFWLAEVLILGMLFFRRRSLKMFLPMLIFFATMGTWSGVNYLRTGYFHYSSIKTINLLHYNTNYALYDVYGEEKADSVILAIEAEAKQKESFAESEKYAQGRAMELIKANFGSYLKFHIKGMLNYFIDPGRFDIWNFFGWEDEDFPGLLYYFSKYGYGGIWQFLKEQPLHRGLMLILVMIANAIVTGLMAAYFFMRRFPVYHRWTAMMFIFYLAGATGPIGAARFKMPVYPLILFCAAQAAWGIWMWWSKRKKVTIRP